MTAFTSGRTLESLEDQQIDQHLRDVENRLVTQYAGRPGMSEPRIRHTFEQVSKRFTDARIRAFLPILIERAVHHELDR